MSVEASSDKSAAWLATLSWPRKVALGAVLLGCLVVLGFVGRVIAGAAFGWGGDASVETPQAAAMQPPFPTVRRSDQTYQRISFTLLGGYGCSIPDDLWQQPKVAAATIDAKIPQVVRDLDGQRVKIEGFMLPVLGEIDKVPGFVLLANQMGCCFGITPPLNWWIDVTMAGHKTVRVRRDEVTAVYGTLHIGPLIGSGTVESLYRLDADAVERGR